MAINGKKIYEQPAWNGDKSMVIHAQKPGTSEAISVQNILDLVADLIPNTTGDIVLRAAGYYEDALVLDGTAVAAPADHPELAAIFGVDGSMTGGAIKTFSSVSTQINVAPVSVTKTPELLIVELVDKYICFNGASVYTVSRPSELQTARAVFVAGSTYCIAKSGSGYSLVRLTSNLAVATGYAGSSMHPLADDVRLGNFLVLKSGDSDLVLDFASNVFKRLRGGVLSDFELNGLEDFSYVGGMWSAATSGDRLFVGGYHTATGENHVIQLQKSGDSFEKIDSIHVSFNSCMRANDTHIFCKSAYVRGTEFPELIKIDIETKEINTVSEFLSDSGNNYFVSNSGVIIVDTGTGLVYESVDGLAFDAKNAADYGLSDLKGAYFSDSSKVIYGTSSFVEYEASLQIKLPIIETQTENLKYFVKF